MKGFERKHWAIIELPYGLTEDEAKAEVERIQSTIGHDTYLAEQEYGKHYSGFSGIMSTSDNQARYARPLGKWWDKFEKEEDQP